MFSVSGGKFAAVKMVLGNMPEMVFDLVYNHISSLGWQQSVFSDDSTSHTKIYPGFVFKSTKPAWTERLVVTERSMLLHMGFVIAEHMQKLPNVRRIWVCINVHASGIKFT